MKLLKGYYDDDDYYDTFSGDWFSAAGNWLFQAISWILPNEINKIMSMLLGEHDFSDNFIYDGISNKQNEEWNSFQAKDVLIYIEKISKTKVLLTTKNGEIILENFEYDKAKLLIAVIASSGLEITNIQYDYNVWIAFIILPLTLTCTLG